MLTILCNGNYEIANSFAEELKYNLIKTTASQKLLKSPHYYGYSFIPKKILSKIYSVKNGEDYDSILSRAYRLRLNGPNSLLIVNDCRNSFTNHPSGVIPRTKEIVAYTIDVSWALGKLTDKVLLE